MSVHLLKTNLKCSGCVAAITPLLSAESSIESWEVDLAHPDKVLTVKGEVSPEKVTALLQQAGFRSAPYQPA